MSRIDDNQIQCDLCQIRRLVNKGTIPKDWVAISILIFPRGVLTQDKHLCSECVKKLRSTICKKEKS